MFSASGQRVSRGPSNSISNALFRAFLESRLEVLSHGFLQAPNSHCKRIDAVIGQLSNRRNFAQKDRAFRGNCGLAEQILRPEQSQWGRVRPVQRERKPHGAIGS